MRTPCAPSTPEGAPAARAGLDPWWLVLLALGLGLRLWGLGRWSFWSDETATLHFARMAPGEIWGVDTHPPLYYLLIHVWRGLGEQEATLRLSSALVSAASLPLIYRAGAALGGRAVARWAMLLLALAPMALVYAQELRMYALLEFAGALALAGLVPLFRDPAAAAGPWRRTRTPWLLWGAGALLAVYSHNTGLLLPASASLAALLCWWRRPERRALARRWLLVTGAVLLLWLIYLPAFLAQAGWVADNFWVRTPGLLRVLTDLAWIHLGGDARVSTLPPGLLAAALLALLALAVAGVLARPGRSLLALLLLLIALPPTLELLAGVVRPIFLPRTLIWTALPTVLLMALGAEWLRRRRAGGLLLAAALGARLLLAGQVYGDYRKPDWRAMSALVAAAVPTEELLLVDPYFDAGLLVFYLERDHPEAPLPRMLPINRWHLEEARATLAAEPRDGAVWLLQSGRVQVLEDPGPALRQALPCARLAGVWLVQGLLLARYEAGGC